MSIFGKDHYSKFCIAMFSWQKMAEGEYLSHESAGLLGIPNYGSVQFSKIIRYINYVLSQLCVVFISTSYFCMSHFLAGFFMRIIGTFFKN